MSGLGREERSIEGGRGGLRKVLLLVQRLGVGLVIERSLVRLAAGALSNQLGHVNSALHPSGVGKWLWFWRGAFTCVGWQVTLCAK